MWAEWTQRAVETRLIAAFSALPGTPLRGHERLRLANGASSPMTAVFAWRVYLKADPDGCAYLFAWARCRAEKESFAEYCRNARWSRSTAEDGRRRAAATIAAALAAGTPAPHLAPSAAPAPRLAPSAAPAPHAPSATKT